MDAETLDREKQRNEQIKRSLADAQRADTPYTPPRALIVGGRNAPRTFTADERAESLRLSVERMALQIVSMRAHAAIRARFDPPNVRLGAQANIEAMEHALDLYLEEMEKPPADLVEGLAGHGIQVGPRDRMPHAERIALRTKHKEKREAAIAAALETCTGKVETKL
jgi:hypothetical protein